MIYQPRSIQRCTKCNTWHCATVKFFPYAPKKQNGLCSWCRKCHAKQSHQYAKNHIENTRKLNNEYNARNRKRRNEYAVHYRKKHHKQSIEYGRLWRAKYSDQENKKRRQKHTENPAIVRTRNHRRKARKQFVISTFTHKDWEYALNYFHHVCAYCGNPPTFFDRYPVLHEDHFIPLSKQGNYTPDNIVPACEKCNLSKNNNDPYKWIANHFGAYRAKSIIIKIQSYIDHIRSRNTY